MNQNLKTIFDFIEQNENLSAYEKSTISKAVKDVDKELALTTFKLDRTEKVKRTTTILLEETIEELEQKRKAVEAQNRELEIEAALERIRAGAMAMRDSSALSGIINKLYSELTNLDAKLDRCFIMIVNPENQGITWWMAGPEGLLAENGFFVQMNQHASHLMYLDYCKKREKKWTYLFEGKEKRDWDRFGFSKTELARLPKPIKAFMSSAKKVHLSGSSDQFGSLVTGSFEPLPDEQQEIISRFSVAFNQAYIRFLDIQKAEIQARESQIEASLERVRSKTMAMHNSQDVGESVATLFDELIVLGVLGKDDRCGIGIMHPDEMMEAWTAAKTVEGKAELTIGYLNMAMHPLLKAAYGGWKTKKETNQYILKGEDKLNYHEAIRKQSEYKIKRDYFSSLERIVHTDFYFTEGCLYVFSSNEISAELASVFIRFANVFGQTYRRYLDLQKAEAQTREAQIEAALERVRSRSLAMHKGEELVDVLINVHEKLTELKVDFDSVNILIFQEHTKDIEYWTINNVQQKFAQFNCPYVDYSAPLDIAKARADKLSLISKNYHGKEHEELLYYLFEQSDFSKLPQERKQMLRDSGEYTVSIGIGNRIGIQINSYHRKAFTAEENEILKRFTTVFEQAYIRFLDLQKAEMQAKEAIKASSLDRVRGEIASMRTVDDLQRITPIIWHELTALGVPFVRCGVFIMNEATEHVQVHLSAPNGRSLGLLDLPFNSSELTINSVNHWRQGIIFKTHWNKQEFLNFMQSMIKEGQVMNPETYQGAAAPPESLDLHFVPFKQGMLYVGSSLPLEVAELQLVKSLAESFSIAYARYEDFRQLEEAKNQIEKTFTELKAAQAQLIQSEKMASLGELTAGIAHEIQNPLNFVNNFSEVSNELMDEMKEELANGNMQPANEIAEDIRQNLKKINHHGKRAADIVKGMLQHSRTSSGVKEPTDINALADEYLRLAYHGLRAKDKSFNADFKTEFDETLPKINVIPQDIGRVLLNLINNAFYAVNEKRQSKNIDYLPVVSIGTKKQGDKVQIKVRDNGNGIPKNALHKIFQPFFTTKPTGQGTGLGLSLSYDIVKVHGGEIKVETRQDEGTEFTVFLPL